MSSGPLKAILPERDLPNFVLFKDGSFGYRVRYRIVSDDGNRTSHYSPIYSVKPNYVFLRPDGAELDDIDVVRRRRYINIFWGTVAARERVAGNFIKNIGDYDVWLKWNGESDQGIWIPAERAENEGSLLGFVVPGSYTLSNGTVVQEEPTRLSIEVYVRARPQSREFSTLLVYKLDDEDIAIPVGPPPI